MRLFVEGQFPKVRFLPRLTFRQWYAIWAVAIALSLGNWLGSADWVGLNWWPFSWDVSSGTMLVFVLLAFTPLDLAFRQQYLIRRGSEGDFYPCSRWFAWRMHARDPEIEIHRVILKHGKVVHGERLK